MAYHASTLANLAKIRKSGHRPDGPVAICDNPISAHWAVRNGFCMVDRRDVGDDLSAFAGLDALVFTLRPIHEAVEFGKQLAETCRYVTIVDALHRRRSEFL